MCVAASRRWAVSIVVAGFCLGAVGMMLSVVATTGVVLFLCLSLIFECEIMVGRRRVAWIVSLWYIDPIKSRRSPGTMDQDEGLQLFEATFPKQLFQSKACERDETPLRSRRPHMPILPSFQTHHRRG